MVWYGSPRHHQLIVWSDPQWRGGSDWMRWWSSWAKKTNISGVDCKKDELVSSTFKHNFFEIVYLEIYIVPRYSLLHYGSILGRRTAVGNIHTADASPYNGHKLHSSINCKLIQTAILIIFNKWFRHHQFNSHPLPSSWFLNSKLLCCPCQCWRWMPKYPSQVMHSLGQIASKRSVLNKVLQRPKSKNRNNNAPLKATVAFGIWTDAVIWNV